MVVEVVVNRGLGVGRREGSFEDALGDVMANS
jgi:hypothetical protein